MNKFCPFIPGECKGASCVSWITKGNKCSWEYEASLNEEIITMNEEEEKSGLLTVNKSLNQVLTRNFLRSLSKSHNISDTDRRVVERLVEEKEKIEETQNLDKLIGDTIK